LLHEWAKRQALIRDESVPISAALNEERTKWIGKILRLRQIGTIEPGMRRSDLLRVFKTDVGLSNPTQRMYVYIECSYIRVSVRFKAATTESPGLGENSDDIIESISQPYLGWSVMD